MKNLHAQTLRCEMIIYSHLNFNWPIYFCNPRMKMTQKNINRKCEWFCLRGKQVLWMWGLCLCGVYRYRSDSWSISRARFSASHSSGFKPRKTQHTSRMMWTSLEIWACAFLPVIYRCCFFLVQHMLSCITCGFSVHPKNLNSQIFIFLKVSTIIYCIFA